MTVTRELISFDGGVILYWYGVLCLVGYLLFLTVNWYLPRREDAYSCPEFMMLMLALVWAALIGGKLGNLIFYGAFETSRSFSLAALRGGLSFHGSFLLMVGTVLVWSRIKVRPFYIVADRIAIAAPCLLVLGRVGNFLNNEIYGVSTNFFLAVSDPNQEDLIRHPVQLYEAAGYLAFFCLIMLAVKLRRVKLGSGVPLALFLAGYSLVRIPAEFLKAELYLLADLQVGVWLTLPMLLAGLMIILRCNPKKM